MSVPFCEIIFIEENPPSNPPEAPIVSDPPGILRPKEFSVGIVDGQ